MKRVLSKVLVIFVFVTTFFVLKSAVSAVHAVGISGYLDNRQGSIDSRVTLNFYKNGSTFIGSQSVTVFAGTRSLVSATDNTGDNPQYLLTWSTDCDFGSANNIPKVGSAYVFADQDVHCTQPHADISISGVTCPLTTGNVSWSVQNYGSSVLYVNIDYFKVYKSYGGDPDADPNPITVNYLLLQTTYSVDVGTGLQQGNWNIKVKGFTNLPDNNFVQDVGLMSCGTGVTAPANLNANVGCQSNQVRVDFTWGPATIGTFDYLVETNEVTNPGFDGSWTAPSITPTPATANSTFSLGQHNTYAITYYWRVRATRQDDGLVIYSAASTFNTPTTCFGVNINPPNVSDLSNNGALTCAPVNPNDDWAINLLDWDPANINKDWVMFKWSRATPNSSIVPNEEYVEFSTDGAFLSGVNQRNVYSNPPDAQGAKTITDFDFVADQQYFWRIKTKMTDGNWYTSEVREFKTPNGCADLAGSALQIEEAYAFCHGPHSGVRLRWRTGSGSWSSQSTNFGFYNGGSYNFFTSTKAYSVDRVPTGVTPELVGATVRYAISKGTGSGQAYAISEPITILNCSASGNLTPPQSLNISTGAYCVGAEVYVPFRFTDQANNESEFWLEVSTEPFTSNSTTNPSNSWGLRRITRTGYGPTPSGESAQTNAIINFTWRNTDVNNSIGAMQSGDANPADPATALTPLEGVVYYWRVKAYNPTFVSAYRYPDGSTGTLYPSGASFTTPFCSPRYDLSLSVADGGGFKNWTDQEYDINETATLEITVVNKAGLGVEESVPTTLYVYPSGSPVASCTSSPQNSPPTTTPPVVAFSVPEVPAGGSVTIPISFSVGSITASRTAHAYVTPSCTYTSGAEVAGAWANNRTSSGFTYSIGIKKFFEARGGDVGAVGTIATGINSTDPNRASGGPWPILYQSQYLLAGGSLADNVSSFINADPAGFRLNNYTKNQFSGGVYDYFRGKFRNKANTNLCSATPGQIVGGAFGSPATVNISGLAYCAGDVQITGDIDFNGVGALFVDGDLDIKGNITTGSNDGIVFIVQGNIVANNWFPFRIVKDLEGIYIARDTFYDSGQVLDGNSFINGTPLSNEPDGTYSYYRLKVTGSVYADGQSGSGFDLARYANNAPTSARYPTTIFIYDPKYLLILSNLLSTAPVGWDEVAP